MRVDQYHLDLEVWKADARLGARLARRAQRNTPAVWVPKWSQSLPVKLRQSLPVVISDRFPLKTNGEHNTCS